MLAIRLIFAPAIISSYTTYGAIAAARNVANAGRTRPLLRDYLAGGVVGFFYGSYYVATGNKLGTFLFEEADD